MDRVRQETEPKALPPPQASQRRQVNLPAKITELEDSCVRVHKQILGLDVTVTHALGVDVGQAPEELVHIHLGWAGHTRSAPANSPHSTLGPHEATVHAGWPMATTPELLAPNFSACHNHLKAPFPV